MQKNTYKRLLMITLAFLFTLTIVGAASAADGQTRITVNSASGSQGQPVTLSASLERDPWGPQSWQAYSGRTLNFNIDGNNYQATTNAAGVASITYNIPAGATVGPHTITVSYSGGWGYGGTSNTGTLTVTAADINPDAVNDVATVNEDGTLNGDVSTNDNRGNTPSTFSVVTNPTRGTLNLNSATGTYTYTPTANYYGPDSFTYRITDNDGDTDTATVSITVNSVNDAPVAPDYTKTTAEDTALNDAVTGTDIEGNPLTYGLISGPVNGNLVFNPSGTYTYTPNANFYGSDSFTYFVRDSFNAEDLGMVTITITPVNDAPVANDDTVTTDEDTSVVVDVLANDLDVDGNPLLITDVTPPSSGSVILSGNTVTYYPFPNWFGAATFQYTIFDYNGGLASGIVTVNVNPVNDDPVATGDSKTTDEDTPVSGSVTATDIDGDTLTFSQGTAPSNGNVVVNSDGTYTYTPNANWNGIDTFTIIVSDGQGGTDTATVTITVNAVNDAPVADDATVNTNEDAPLSDSLAGSDIDGGSLTFALGTGPSNGVITVNSDGTYTYTPNANYNGPDSFTFIVNDGNGGTDQGTISITVNAVNDAPVSTDTSVTIPEDGAVGGPGRATDVDGDPLTYSVSDSPDNGNVFVNPTNGLYQYIPNTNWNGVDSFTVTASDGNGGTTTYTVTITVTPVNDAPVAMDNTVTANEDSSTGYDVLGNDYDADGDSLTITGVTQPTNGVVVNYGTYIEYTPNSNFNGADSFTYTISDGNGEIATATVYVTVNPVNDSPVATDDSATTKEETPVTIDVLDNDSDVEGDILTVSGVSDPANGSVTINADGTVTYTPDANFYGTDSFTYTISDGNEGQKTGTVTINVVQKVSSVYVLTTASKNNLTVGETIKITFKLGNNGPDTAENVKFTYILPEGLEYVSMSGDGTFSYDAATRTITWNLGDVPVGDPYLYVNVRVLRAGSFVIDPTVTTDTYDTALPASVQSVTINAVEVVKAASSTTVNTVGMQETGIPVTMFVLAILAVLGGFVIPKRK